MSAQNQDLIILSLDETADLLHIKVSTLRNWIHRKIIPFVKMNGRVIFIKETINEYIRSKEHMPVEF